MRSICSTIRAFYYFERVQECILFLFLSLSLSCTVCILAHKRGTIERMECSFSRLIELSRFRGICYFKFRYNTSSFVKSNSSVDNRAKSKFNARHYYSKLRGPRVRIQYQELLKRNTIIFQFINTKVPHLGIYFTLLDKAYIFVHFIHSIFFITYVFEFLVNIMLCR